jgi:hypothetical protein
MSNKEMILDWVKKKEKIKRMKGFRKEAISKELNILNEDVFQCCMKLVHEGLLDTEYYYSCGCDFSGTAQKMEEVPKHCEWCDEEITDIETMFKFKR